MVYQLSPKEIKLGEEALRWIKRRENRNYLIAKFADPKKHARDKNHVAIFMAGSPGAGKTETSKALIESLAKISGTAAVRIDPDELRAELPQYNGANAALFNAAVSRGVNELIAHVLKHRLSFCLDGTLKSTKQAQLNIKRSRNRGYTCAILYVYQDPIVAWKFTQARCIKDGRVVPMESFIDQYFAARASANTIKSELGKEITLMVVERTFEGPEFKTWMNAESIDGHIPERYASDTLREIIENGHGKDD